MKERRLSEIHAGFIAEHGRAYERLLSASPSADFSDFAAVLGYYAEHGFLEADAAWSYALGKFPYGSLPPDNRPEALRLVGSCYRRAFSDRRARSAQAFSNWLAKVPGNGSGDPMSHPFITSRADLAELLGSSGFLQEAYAVAESVLKHDFPANVKSPYGLARIRARRVIMDALCECPGLVPDGPNIRVARAREAYAERPGISSRISLWRAKASRIMTGNVPPADVRHSH